MIRLFTFLLAIVISSCASSVLVERSEHLPAEKTRLKNASVLLLEPQAQQIDIVNSAGLNYSRTDALQKKFEHYLRRSARKNNVNLQMKSIAEVSDNNLAFHQQLVNLRNHVLQANLQQGLSPDRVRNYSGLQERVMAFSPQLFPELSALAKITGTPYVAFSGWTYIDANNITMQGETLTRDTYKIRGRKNYFYFIVVNLETAEIMYREAKAVEGKVSESVLLSSLYDSFFLFSKHIGKS